jgi:hypothetical protein
MRQLRTLLVGTLALSIMLAGLPTAAAGHTTAPVDGTASVDAGSDITQPTAIVGPQNPACFTTEAFQLFESQITTEDCLTML